MSPVRVEAEEAGAIFVNEQTVREGRYVTAQTWQSHPSFYREIFAQLSGIVSAAPLRFRLQARWRQTRFNSWLTVKPEEPANA